MGNHKVKDHNFRRYYKHESLLELMRDDILEISKRLSKIHILLRLKLYEEYEDYRIKRKESLDQNDIDINSFKINSSRRKVSSPQKNNYVFMLNSNVNYVSNLIQSGFISMFRIKIDSNDDEMNLFTSKKIEDNDEYFDLQTPIDEYERIREKDMKCKNKVCLKGICQGNEDITNKIVLGSQKEFDIKVNMNPQVDENYFIFNQEKRKYNVNDEENIFNLKFDFIKRCSKDKFTKNDIIKFKQRKVLITNSILLYLNHFWRKYEFYEFNKNLSTNVLSIEVQNFQCFLCYRRFKKCHMFEDNDIFWCSYYLRYVCGKCYSNDYSVIPMFVLKCWDFKKYTISIKAKDILIKYYDYPTIQFKASDNLIQKSSALKYCVTIKRKIHRIYDLIKCNAEELALNILGDYKYLVLIENIFSLKDICEIDKGLFSLKIYDFFVKFEKHILKDCKHCEYQGKECYNCNNGEILMAYDVDKVFFCKMCTKAYHRKCSIVHECKINN